MAKKVYISDEENWDVILNSISDSIELETDQDTKQELIDSSTKLCEIDLKDDLQTFVEYYYEMEYCNYCESGKPEDHMFHTIKKFKNIIKTNE